MLFAFLGALGFTRPVAPRSTASRAATARAAFSRPCRSTSGRGPRRSGRRTGGGSRRTRCASSTRRIRRSRSSSRARRATLDFLDEESRAPPRRAQELLREAGVRFAESAAIVRGLDYYTRTVFEVASERLGAQNAILGGGRYDGLVGRSRRASRRPRSGFAIGEDRLVTADGGGRAPAAAGCSGCARLARPRSTTRSPSPARSARWLPAPSSRPT